MPTSPEALLAFAHRLLCAAVIAHSDLTGRQALLRPGSDAAVRALDRLVRSPEGLRLAIFLDRRSKELETLLQGADAEQARERVALWTHAVARAALDAAVVVPRSGDEPRLDGWSVEIRDGRAVFTHPRAVLTGREYAVLRALVRHAGITLTREQLLKLAWPEEPNTTANTVDVYIGYLRRKLGAETVTTVRGMGYRVDAKVVERLR